MESDQNDTSVKNAGGGEIQRRKKIQDLEKKAAGTDNFTEGCNDTGEKGSS